MTDPAQELPRCSSAPSDRGKTDSAQELPSCSSAPSDRGKRKLSKYVEETMDCDEDLDLLNLDTIPLPPDPTEVTNQPDEESEENVGVAGK